MRLTFFLFLNLILSGIFFTASSNSFGATEECARSLKLVNRQTADNVAQRAFKKINSKTSYSSLEIKTFLKSGWPEFKKIAASEELTPTEFMRKIYVTLFFMMEQIMPNRPADWLAGLHASSDKLFNIVRWLETKNLEKLKGDDLKHVQLLMNAILGISLQAMESEMTLLDASELNPMLPMDAKQINLIFQICADATEEVALRVALGEYDKVAEVELPVESPAELVPDFSHKYIPRTTSEILPDTQNLSANLETPVQLKAILADLSRLTENQNYEFENAHRGKYTISFNNDVVKDAGKGQGETIKKLLSTLFLGSGIGAGIKMLPELGRGVVQIKGVFRGHKRLLGCLEGRHIFIRKFLDIGTTVASYSKAIPKDFCN